MAKKVIVGGRIESKEVGGIVTGAAEILDDTKGKKQSVINQETDNELARLDQSKQDNLTFDNVPTEGSNNPVKSAGVYEADKALSDAIEAILLLIPGAASALNKLVDMATMNSSISTATATFKGTYNVVTDLELAIDATHEQIAAKLAQVVSEADNNDYAFVQIPVSAESTDIRRTERYKFNGTAWAYEYDLNTSGFTAAQWAAINSGITLALVAKLVGLPTSSELLVLLGQKQDTLTFDNVPTAGSNNPVKSGGINTVISNETEARQQLAQSVSGIDGRVGDVEEVIPAGAAANNKLVANNSMEAYVASIIDAITASFTIATADGHINLTLTQTNGRVASLTLTSSDIASAQALTALTGRVSTAEGNITSLGGRVSTNETDIANLQQLYNDLQQSKPEPVTALPSTGQQQGVIYRLAGTTSYSDYMWNGSTWVLMATYNNAIDPRPKKASQNLVTSGGVFDNMGALDVSELNATENPHTLAQYVDLSAALAAIPTDYQKGGMSIKFVQSSDNKYVQYRLMADSWSINPNDWSFCGDNVLVENPEWIYVLLDAEKRILAGLKSDGSVEWSIGIPTPVKEYIDNATAEIKNGTEGTDLDGLNKIITFLSEFSTSDTLKDLLDKKVDGEYVENPEYIEVKTDAEDKILEATEKDGTKLFGGDVKVLGSINISGVSYKVASNPEWLKVALDAEDKIICGIKTDGKFVVYVADFLDDIEAIKSRLKELDAYSVIENPEFLEVELDANDKILGGRKADGTKFENNNVELNGNATVGGSLEVNGVVIKNGEDPENRSEITLDSEDKIVSYRKDDGTKVENVGIEADKLILSKEGLNELQERFTIPAKKFSLPKYGNANIVSETFYLTSDNRYSDKNGVYLIEDYPDTPSTAREKITVGYFYIKSTLRNNGDGTYSKYNDGVTGHDVKLDFYAASKVTKIDSSYYVTSTLTEVVDPETSDVSYEINEDSVEVTQITDVPPLKAWSVDKKTEHYCVVVINFGYYLSGTFYIGVKYQGSSSLTWWKRNLRFTFYKNNKYEKKDKVKIGEMVRLSGYNLKSGYSDKMRIKESILYNLIIAIYEHRDIYDQYPWNKEYTPYTGATGLIKSFPIRVEIGGEFYGIYNFGLKKDEKNYMLDGDASGMFLCGEGRNWTAFNVEDWTDEMNDEMTQSNIDAMTAFYSFINDESQFTKENIPTHMSVIDWIDYIIIMQTFYAVDNTLRNMILYSNSDKIKMTPFWYDLDLCWKFYDSDTYTDIIGDNQQGYDMSIYQNFLKSYWDEVVNRYADLRKSVLNIDYITKVHDDIMSGIPKDDYEEDIEKWGSSAQGSHSVFSYVILTLKYRLEWLDKVYFKV